MQSATLRTLKLSLTCQDGASVGLLTVDGAVVNLSLRTWRPLTVTVRAPAGTVKVVCQLVMSASVAVNDSWYFDHNCLREKGEQPDGRINGALRHRAILL